MSYGEKLEINFSLFFLRNIQLVLRTEEFFPPFLRPVGSKRFSLTFSGAENEALFSYFLRREERSKEASTLTKPSPIWEGCN